jgi:Flp pilus assembly pilin Flp
MIEHLFARLDVARAEEESGQTMAEYAVVLAVITIAVVAVLAALSTAIQGQLNAVIGAL